MFPGMFPAKPDKTVALRQLRTHVAMFAGWVVVLRVAPYVLHYFSEDDGEVKFEL